MAGAERRSPGEADETRTPPNAKVEVVRLSGVTVGRATFQPGWRWSESIKPVAGTDSCQVHHLGVLLSGRMHVVHEDGTEVDLSAGDVYNVEPGHDAWVVGEEEVVGVEFDMSTAESFAKG